MPPSLSRSSSLTHRSIRHLILWPLLAAVLLAAGCTEQPDEPSDPPDTPGAFGGGVVAVPLTNGPVLDFSGDGVWPPEGDGVVAGLDTTGTIFQYAGYTQLTLAKAGPETKFRFVFVQVTDTLGIRPASWSNARIVLGLNTSLADAETTAYVGVNGNVTIGAFGSGGATGTFSGTLTRISDGAPLGIATGSFDVEYASRIFIDDDDLTGLPSIAVSVDTGLTPRYSWTGGPVFALSVSVGTSGSPTVWSVVTFGVDTIFSPVTHGTVPPGATRVVNEEPVLTEGRTYRVTVSRLDGSYGVADFTP